MRRVFSILIIFGLIVWLYLLWERAHLNERVEGVAEKVDDANAASRCAKYRVTDGGDESTWSLGYVGRIRQLVSGCF